MLERVHLSSCSAVNVRPAIYLFLHLYINDVNNAKSTVMFKKQSLLTV
jgi:hypothetical protein